ncbi:MAG: 50S ribosomal protein L15 [Planctomycetes bacterium]|mgnify:CR=1 FL=1|jgi:large subunit ribosomal protein L15|nr:50S ribosomal protein L15 [Planctomycetota bacterium]
MKLDEILSKAGKYKARKRLGRGTGSGQGKTAGRGTKGMYSRSGAKHRIGYEGGQTPIISRIPKRGFSNAQFRKTYQVVNVCDLEKFEVDAKIDAAALFEAGLISDKAGLVKILGNGELTKKVHVVAGKFSATASEKITKAGGTTQQA